MRPDSLRKFDLLYLGAMALGAVNVAVSFDALAAMAEQAMAAQGVAGFGRTAMLAGVIGGFCISLLLWFLVSRARLGFMKWILLLLLAYNLVSLPSTQLDVRANTLLSLASLAMQAGAIWFLFRPDARAWFDSKGQ
jgi:hypothetical protein